MERRDVIRAGWLASVGAFVSCSSQKSAPPVQTETAQPPAPPRPAVGLMGSLPTKLVRGPGQGMQLFIHGLCGFVLPQQSSDPLRVAMLKGYPDDAAHRHYATLLVPRTGVDLAASTAEPSAVDGNHVIYGLHDMYVTVAVSNLTTPALKVKKSSVPGNCAVKGNWDDMGWVLNMKDLDTGNHKLASWDKIGTVSQAQFETNHGSLETDFDTNEQPSEIDTNEWNIRGTNRNLKQSVRLRIKDAGPVSLVLKSRSTGNSTSIVLLTQGGTVNAAILNLPAQEKVKQNKGVRLTDALAYYQMFDPSPLNAATDNGLEVPIWTDNPDNCSTVHSPECMCCPPSMF